MLDDFTTGLLAVAGLGCLTAAVMHSVLGERYFVRPILARMDWSGVGLSSGFARRVVRLAWHVTSVTWAGFALILLAPLTGASGTLAVYAIAAATFAAGFVLTGPGTGWRHRGWPVFAVITVALLGVLMLAY
jgi:hypothetical protein